MMEQVRLCAVWPMENWLGSSLNHIQGWTTVRESYSHALEQGPLPHRVRQTLPFYSIGGIGILLRSPFALIAPFPFPAEVCSLPPFRCSNIITAPMIENNGQLKCEVAKGYNHSFNPTDEMGREKRAMG